jgi:tetratricopeptide (TPR) repeat protein
LNPTRTADADGAKHPKDQLEEPQGSNRRSASILPVPTVHFVFFFMLSACSEIETSDGVKGPQPSGPGQVTIGEPPAVSIDQIDDDLAKLLESRLEAARRNPESGEERGRLAEAYDVNGYEAAALEAYAQAASLAPESFAWPYLHALLHGRLGDYARALERMERALAIDEGYAPAWLWQGEWLLALDRTTGAIAAYERARSLGAEIYADAGIARALLRNGEARRAAELLDPLTRQIDHPYLARMLGRALRAVGRTDEARIAFEKGRADVAWQWRDPRAERKNELVGGFAGRLVRAQTAIRTSDIEEAMGLLRKLEKEDPNDPALLRVLALAYSQTGQVKRAIDVLERALEAHADYAYYFHGLLASNYLRVGNGERARHHTERAIQLSPKQSGRHVQLGTLLVREGEPDAALAAFDAALASGVRDPHNVLFAAGLIERELKLWGAALARFEKATAIEPGFALAHVQVALCNAELGKFAEARAALDRAARNGAHEDAVHDARSRLIELEAAAVK